MEITGDGDFGNIIGNSDTVTIIGNKSRANTLGDNDVAYVKGNRSQAAVENGGPVNNATAKVFGDDRFAQATENGQTVTEPSLRSASLFGGVLLAPTTGGLSALALPTALLSGLGSNNGPFLGLIGNGADAPADCTGDECNGGDGGLLFGTLRQRRRGRLGHGHQPRQ